MWVPPEEESSQENEVSIGKGPSVVLMTEPRIRRQFQDLIGTRQALPQELRHEIDSGTDLSGASRPPLHRLDVLVPTCGVVRVRRERSDLIAGMANLDRCQNIDRHEARVIGGALLPGRRLDQTFAPHTAHAADAIPQVDLAVVSKTADATRAHPNQLVTYTIVATNYGPDTALTLDVYDLVDFQDSGLQLVNESCDQGISADTPAFRHRPRTHRHYHSRRTGAQTLWSQGRHEPSVRLARRHRQ